MSDFHRSLLTSLIFGYHFLQQSHNSRRILFIKEQQEELPENHRFVLFQSKFWGDA